MNAPTRMPTPVPVIPPTAPFTTEQRAWLSGFFAAVFSTQQSLGDATYDYERTGPDGFVETGGEAPANGDVPWHDPSLPLAERMQLAAGQPLNRRMMAAMAQQDCGQCGSNCEDYAKSIAMRAEERLNLCAPGGKETARMLKSLLAEAEGSAAPREVARDTGDTTTIRGAQHDSAVRKGYSSETPIQAVFVARRKLNGDGSEKSTFHVELDISGSGIDYEVGDSLGIFPRNDPRLVDRVLEVVQAPANFPIGERTLRGVLEDDVSLGAAPDMLFELLSYITGGARRAKAKALARGEDPDGDARALDVLAALEKFSGRPPDPEAFIEALDPLQPRLYSISSSHIAHPGRVSLTVDHVHYKVGDRERLGVASTYISRALRPGDVVRAYIQRAHDFSLPADGATPIIMVGPGTGVAPFRAFLQERAARQANGPAWLFFGHQKRDTDFLYEADLADFLASGTLTKLSLAWSRDGDRKIYVQDKMREDAGLLWSWLVQGAHFYVCGDAKRMAVDVEKTLAAICVEQGGMDPAGAKLFLKEMRGKGRYQTDVY